MKGKYQSFFAYAGAWVKREALRRQLREIVDWEPLGRGSLGCTVVIGMCSRLPHVLAANLRCLAASRWPELSAIIIAVDSVCNAAFAEHEAAARNQFPDLPVEFVYYSDVQSALAEKLKLPFVYAWLSWCLAIAKVETRHLFIHDYDALILGPSLGARYRKFSNADLKVQGIGWYEVNGIDAADRLCTTFELFADTAWFRSMPPLNHFNKVGAHRGRLVDFDITLWAQTLLAENQRQIAAMDSDQLVHPSQMIHQYTMFRRLGPVPLPCFSMPMIPFFTSLGGDDGAIGRAAHALSRTSRSNVDIIGDGTRLNLDKLDVAQVDWALKQMVQASLRLAISPSADIRAYGDALYSAIGTPSALRWIGDFTEPQRSWISESTQRYLVSH